MARLVLRCSGIDEEDHQPDQQVPVGGGMKEAGKEPRAGLEPLGFLPLSVPAPDRRKGHDWLLRNCDTFVPTVVVRTIEGGKALPEAKPHAGRYS